MRTDANVADGDAPLAGARMNGQFDRNLFVLDRTRVADSFLFATHGDRARYLGKSQREKPHWLKQNEGRFRRLNDIELESVRRALAVESETKVAAATAGPNGETSSPDVRKDGDHEDVASIDTLPRDCSPAGLHPICCTAGKASTGRCSNMARTARSRLGPILFKNPEYRLGSIFSAPWVRFSDADAGGLVIRLRLNGASSKSICGGS